MTGRSTLRIALVIVAIGLVAGSGATPSVALQSGGGHSASLEAESGTEQGGGHTASDASTVSDRGHSDGSEGDANQPAAQRPAATSAATTDDTTASSTRGVQDSTVTPGPLSSQTVTGDVPEVVRVVENNGQIELTFDRTVVQKNTVDTATSSGTNDQLNEHNFTLYVDGNVYDDVSDFDVQYSSGTDPNGAGEDVQFTLTDGAWGDLSPEQDVQLSINGVRADTEDGPVTTPGNQSVTVTSSTVAYDGPYSQQSPALIGYQGEVIALQGQAGFDVSVRRVGGSIQFDGNLRNSTVRAVDTSTYNTGATYRAEFDNSQTQFFNISDLRLTASAVDTSVTAGDSLEVNFSALRGGTDATVTLQNANGDVVASREATLVGGQTQTVTFDSSSNSGINTNDGPYTSVVTDDETGITATTEEITVSEPPSDDVSLNQTIYSEERGDVATIGIELSNTDTATVTIGTTGENNWAQNVTVEDGDGDDFVTLRFNTYTAGTSDNGYRVYSTADDADSVVNVAPDSGAFDASDLVPTPSEKTLGDGDYAVSAVAGTTPASETTDGEDAAATLSLSERSTDSITTYVAPEDRASDIVDSGDVSTLQSDDNITESSVVVDGDVLLTRIDASGLEGVLANRTAGDSPNATAAFFEEQDSDSAAWRLVINQTNPGTNAVAYSATLDAINTDLIADANDDTYWLVVDTDRVAELSAGDELMTNFTTTDADDINDDTTTVRDEWAFEEPTATVDTNADTDDDGSVDEVSVQRAVGQTISGTANVAPGTELTVKVTGTDSGSPFVKPLTTYVQPDGTWSTTADFSENAQGANFTVNVRRGNEQIIDQRVDGRIAAAPTASVTFNDQSSTGSVVTVDSVTLSDGGFVALHLNNASGTVVGNSSYLEAGSSSDVAVTLDHPLDEDTTLVAMPHQDTDGDEAYEFQFGSSVDAPYTENGSAVTDSASITVDSTSDPSSPFGVQTAAADPGDGQATVRGNLTGLGDAASATVYLVYWRTDTPDQRYWYTGDSVTGPTEYSTTLSLAADTEYAVRAYAESNDSTWVAGDTVRFTTTGTPYAVSLGNATDVGDTTATLAGDLTGLSGVSSAQVYITYWPANTGPSSASWWTGRTLSSPGTFDTTVSGLWPGTTYEYRAYARSDTGRWVASQTDTFETTGESLSADTHAPTQVGFESATLEGELEALGTADSATTYLTYWETGNRQSTLTWWTGTSRSTAGNFTAEVDLAAGTNYTTQALVRSGDGRWRVGDRVTFTTDGTRYAVETGSVTDVTTDSADLSGSLTGLGSADNATVYLVYWEAGRQSETRTWWTGQPQTGPTAFSTTVTGLDPDTTYVVQAYARDSDGTWTAGETVEFTTGQ